MYLPKKSKTPFPLPVVGGAKRISAHSIQHTLGLGLCQPKRRGFSIILLEGIKTRVAAKKTVFNQKRLVSGAPNRTFFETYR